MKNCSNLFYLSTIACKLADCLSEEELAVLTADLDVLSDMLTSISAHSACSQKAESAPFSSCDIT